jgi:hypothetical protein
MEVLKKGNYKLKDWFLEVDCTGEGHKNKKEADTENFSVSVFLKIFCF